MNQRQIRLIAAAVTMLGAAQIARADDDYPYPCNQSQANAVATLWYWANCDWNYPTWNCASIATCTVTGPNNYHSTGEQCFYLDPCGGMEG